MTLPNTNELIILAERVRMMNVIIVSKVERVLNENVVVENCVVISGLCVVLLNCFGLQ